MKMTLSSFIASGGIPAEDTFYLYHPGVFSHLFECVPKKAFLNRRLGCGRITRLRRRLYYQNGIGRIPVDPAAFERDQLFWGLLDGDIMLASVRSLFEQLEKKGDGSWTVFVGATDDSFAESHAAMIPESVERIFVPNCVVRHPKVHGYPLGRDGGGVDSFGIKPDSDKRISAYCNFSPDTHAERKAILELIGNRSFVTRVDVEGYGLYTGYPMTNETFLTQLNSHAFCICPRGAGLDTFRLWDSLHLGVIPIVVHEGVFHDSLGNLPILFLDSVSEFAKLSQSFLEQTYHKMLETEYDFSSLTAGFWEARFQGDSAKNRRDQSYE